MKLNVILSPPLNHLTLRYLYCFIEKIEISIPSLKNGVFLIMLTKWKDLLPMSLFLNLKKNQLLYP